MKNQNIMQISCILYYKFKIVVRKHQRYNQIKIIYNKYIYNFIKIHNIVLQISKNSLRINWFIAESLN